MPIRMREKDKQQDMSITKKRLRVFLNNIVVNRLKIKKNRSKQ